MNGDLYLVIRNGVYCVHGTVNGQRVRVSTRTYSHPEAQLFLENLRREYLSGWRDGYDSEDVTWKTVASLACNRHKQSAKAREIPFDLSPADVFGLMKANDFHCAVSGIPFSKTASGTGAIDPWAASIDRIENRQGYLKDNVRVVCVAANIGMNAWGYNVLLRLANGVVRNAVAVVPEPEKLTQNLDTEKRPLLQVIENKGQL